MNALKDPRRRHLVVLAAIALAANAAALVGGPAELTFAAGYVLPDNGVGSVNNFASGNFTGNRILQDFYFWGHHRAPDRQ
jgi:hypothetical protein